MPQLSMVHRNLSSVPAPAVPNGYEVRTFRSGDEEAWESIAMEAFENDSLRFALLSNDPAYRADRIWFVCEAGGGSPVATASAWHREELDERTGYLHMVAVRADCAGRGLGSAASLAALRAMANEGKSRAVLHTDDFRLPAIKTYLRLGCIPRITDTSHPQRWRDIANEIGGTYLATAPGSRGVE
ncbi:GNAT family N-acetyltransferase [Paenibacillus sp.]|uniref:GNAT family N-acetyltransferase n=1 Tax=Paenibacillus sp. TaxID=58172 RepID=UPI002812585B|nr:GNAT family N-acetyltransferase [Paenibacillus sp.]